MNDELLASLSNAIGSASEIAQLGEILVDFLQGSVQFDRLNIGLIDQDARTFEDAFVYGQNVSGRSLGNVRTLDGTVVEAAMAADGVFAFANHDLDAWLGRFPRFGPVYDSGMRKMLAILLKNRLGSSDAALVLASTNSAPYDTEQMRAIQRVAAIAAEKLFELER